MRYLAYALLASLIATAMPNTALADRTIARVSATHGPTTGGATTHGPTTGGATTHGPTTDGATTHGPTTGGATTHGPPRPM